jgi:SAM-dependent methyltransferase
MACSCCDFTDAAGQQFNAKKAAQQLRDYRRGRVGPTTRLLRDGLVMARLNAGALLDIGAGVGVLTFELLDRGVASAVAVEASSAYLASAVEEASRRNRSAVISFRHGDFVNLASDVPAADVVTLDRVVCCYADYRLLLHNALPRARQALALSYPRDRWFVRFGVRMENALRGFRANTFRTFVHPVDEMQRLIRKGGFELVTRQETAAWSADIYARRA